MKFKMTKVDSHFIVSNCSAKSKMSANTGFTLSRLFFAAYNRVLNLVPKTTGENWALASQLSLGKETFNVK